MLKETFTIPDECICNTPGFAVCTSFYNLIYDP